MLKIYRRCKPTCPNKPTCYDNLNGCQCALWISGQNKGGKQIRESLETRDLHIAQLKRAQFETKESESETLERLEKLLDEREDAAFEKLTEALGDTGLLQGILKTLSINPPQPAPEPQKEITVDYAIDRFKGDAEARKLSSETVKKLRQVTDQLKTFCTAKGFENLRQLDNPDIISEFRETWTDAPRTAKPKFERLRNFFNFCVGRKWIESNPTAALKPPKVDDKPTLPFTEGPNSEMEKILWACEVYSTIGRYRSNNRKRMRVMVLLQRWSGLAIMDACTLERCRLSDDNRLKLRRAKTDEWVYVKLPPFVADELRALESPNPDYFFWTGRGLKTSAVKCWEDAYRTLFRIAGIEDGHSHRFRDTFAVEFLAPTDTKTGKRKKDADGKLVCGDPHHLQMLLGHSSIKTTEKHYMPWVNSRQEQLDEAVEKIWA